MKKLIILVWVMLLLSLMAFSAFADTVPPAGINCKMYYDEEGNACIPPSCRGTCNHDIKVGDKYVDEDGKVLSIVTEIIILYNETGKIEGSIVCADGVN